jgi:uncharacterized protein YdcH (DUF465 family)
METAVKNAPKALHGEAALTVAELMKLEDDLKIELETALTADDIDANEIIYFRERLTQIPVKLAAARISELKTRLNEIHDEILTAEQNKQLIRGEQLERKKELNLKLDEIQPFYDRYENCSLRLSFITIEEEGLRIARRENRALLFSLSEDIRK